MASSTFTVHENLPSLRQLTARTGLAESQPAPEVSRADACMMPFQESMPLVRRARRWMADLDTLMMQRSS